MPLVDEAGVRLVVRTTLSSGSVNQCINAADVVVTEVLANSGLSIPRKTEIERYLAAHLCALADPSLRAVREKVGELEAEYEQMLRTEELTGFQTTRYGQAAMAFDTTGKLRRASNKGLVTFKMVHSNVLNAEYLTSPDIANITVGIFA